MCKNSEEQLMTNEKNIGEYLNIPNALTFLRILIIAPMIISFFNSDYIIFAVCLAVSGLSDFLDGKIARKSNQITSFGAKLDPIADKLTLVALVVCIVHLVPATLPLVIILFVKEFLMLLGGAYLIKNNLPVPSAKWYGKLSTVIFYISIAIIVGLYVFFNYENDYLTLWLIIVDVGFMINSFVRYTMLFMNIIKEKSNGQKGDNPKK